MTDLLVAVALLLVAGFLFVVKRKSTIKELTDLKTDDLDLARKSKEVNKDIELIKKELAEKSLGVTNMSKEEIETFWKGK